jgi:hypothetical protein
MNRSVVKNAQKVFEDGEWWYIPSEGKRERWDQYNTKNARRMWVNGKYIPRSDPNWKAGRWKSWAHVTTLEKLEQIKEGFVYVIVNDAWPDWVKIGCAKDADDRLNDYQTYSPHRDYKVIARIESDHRREKEAEMHKVFEHFALDRHNEWFKIDRVTAIKLFNYQIQENDNEQISDRPSP